MSDVTYRKLRGKHERIGRHEAPSAIGLIVFAPHVSDAQRKAFKRAWENQPTPRGRTK